jgi:hypothetical protein
VLPEQVFYKPVVLGTDLDGRGPTFRSIHAEVALTYRVGDGDTHKLHGVPVLGAYGHHAVRELLRVHSLGYGKGHAVLLVTLGPDAVTDGVHACSTELTVVGVLTPDEAAAQVLGVTACLTGPAGTQWFLDGELHRDGDLPANILPDGEEWYRNGKLHRDGDKPAVVRAGVSKWYKDGLLHREGDRPAYVDTARGIKKWCVNGELHREGDKPAVKCGEDVRHWYVRGRRHRDGDAPAAIDRGRRSWFKDGVLHREGDLPARELEVGTLEWYKHGKLHREGGLPACVNTKGDCAWYREGNLHRSGGLPAVVSRGEALAYYEDGIFVAAHVPPTSGPCFRGIM